MDDPAIPGDAESVEALRSRLLADFVDWLDPTMDPDLVIDVELLLNWRFAHSGASYDRFTEEDIREFLLSWCPHNVIVPPGEELAIVEGVKAWVTHLVLTDAWRGGPVRPMLDLLDEIVPEYLVAMSDASDGAPVHDLPNTASPNPDLVAQQASGAVLLGRLARLREYLGQGRELTARGNPKLADAEMMMEVLVTDDLWERSVAGRSGRPRSAGGLPHLMFLLGVAIDAGALHDDGRTLSAAVGWQDLDPITRCASLLDAALDRGIIGRGASIGHGVPDDPAKEMDGLLDDGVVHLLVPMFVSGRDQIEDIVERALGVVRVELGVRWPSLFDGSTAEGIVWRGVVRVLETFEQLGMVTIDGRSDDQGAPGDGVAPIGGVVSITDLGRRLLEGILPGLGYVVHHSADLDGADASAAVLALATSQMDPARLWREWAPGADPVDKFDQLMDVLAVAGSGPERLAAVALMEQAPAEVRRRAEAMIDGPRAAYALMTLDPRDSPFTEAPDPGRTGGSGGPPDRRTDEEILLSDGRQVGLAIQQLGPERNLAPLVDLLWLEMDVDPEDLIEHVLAIDAGSIDGVDDGDELAPGAFTELLGDLWRVDLPETDQLLAFLASNHPVRSTAEAARGALARHRSTYSDPR